MTEDERHALEAIARYGVIQCARPLTCTIDYLVRQGWVRSHERGPVLLSLTDAGKDALQHPLTTLTK
jgi:hypothetical protein